MKTLFVSDLDGTLLTSAENISPYSLEKLNAMIDGGMPFTYATARSLNSAAKAVWGLRQNLPVILYNGAVIMEPSGGSMLYNNPFNAGQREYIRLAPSKVRSFPARLLFSEGTRTGLMGEGTRNGGNCCAISRAAAATRGCIPWTAKARSMRAIFSILPVSTKRRGLDGLQQSVQTSLDLKTIFEQETYRTDWWCEIMPAATSKGNAARALKEIAGAERLVVFGDGVNDFSLFEAADESYAVQNADDRLKAMASGVIGFSEEDAVAKFLSTYEK